MEPKAKTLIERLGFLDQDRRHCTHDEIQLWVYRNFRSIVKRAFPQLSIDPERNLEVKLEYPITDQRRNFVVGFADVFCLRYSIAIEVKTEIPIVGDVIHLNA